MASCTAFLLLSAIGTIGSRILYIVKFAYLSCIVGFCALVILKSLSISKSVNGVIGRGAAWIYTSNHYDFRGLLVQERVTQYHR
jgi:hypothetical protein